MRRRKKKKLINSKALIAIFFSFIMVSSILSMIFGGNNPPADTLEYEGYEFTREDSFWVIKINEEMLRFHYFPTELSKLNVSEEAIERIKSTKMIYISSPVLTEDRDFTSLASFELTNFFASQKVYSSQAISDNNTGYALPLITCQNSTVFVPVITFRNANQSQLILEDDCIIIEAQNSQDYLRVKDKLMLEYMGIK